MSPSPGPPPRRERVHLGRDPSSPGNARKLVRRLVGDHPRISDIELLVSELATNVVRHTDDGMEVSVCSDDRSVRVEVSDTDPGLPRARPPDASSGRGLHLVEQLADRWGVVGDPPGKVVWFEVDRPTRWGTS